MTSSTSLNLAARHCPAALDFAEKDTPYDRSIFSCGIAAHHVIQSVGEQQVKEERLLEPGEMREVGLAVAKQLIAKGRSFAGRHEPPLPLDQAMEGLEIAVAYLEMWPLPLDGRFEVGLAVRPDWTAPSPYDAIELLEAPYYRGIFDLIHQEDDFETEQTRLILTDWKTSWRADATELETIQRKGQACIVASGLMGMDALLLRVVNLRTHQHYERIVPLDSPLLPQWRAEIDAAIEALEGPRVASPGAGCQGCPYLLVCEDAIDYFERSDVIFKHGSIVERAKAFAVAVSMVGRLRSTLKAEAEPVDTGDSLVGYMVRERRKATKDAGLLLWEKWESRGGDVRGFLAAAGLGLSQIESTCKTLWPERSDAETRQRFIAKLTEADNRSEFKARKK